jgi:hypothetical protein
MARQLNCRAIVLYKVCPAVKLLDKLGGLKPNVLFDNHNRDTSGGYLTVDHQQLVN